MNYNQSIYSCVVVVHALMPNVRECVCVTHYTVEKSEQCICLQLSMEEFAV